MTMSPGNRPSPIWLRYGHSKPANSNTRPSAIRMPAIYAPPSILTPLAEQLEQHHEEVDEVEVQRERPHHRFLAGQLLRIRFQIHGLDALRIVGGEAHKQYNADDRDHELNGVRSEEDVHQRGDYNADQAHEQKGPKPREIGARCKPIDAHRAIGCGRDEEDTCDRRPG